jgi:hypothetical protein
MMLKRSIRFSTDLGRNRVGSALFLPEQVPTKLPLAIPTQKDYNVVTKNEKPDTGGTQNEEEIFLSCTVPDFIVFIVWTCACRKRN